MRKNVNMEFQSQGVVRMLEKQNITPYYQCEGVNELLKEHPMSVTYKMAVSMFMLGYIQGKRAERARRKK